MTKRELIDALAEAPDDAQVVVTGLYGSSTEDIEVETEVEARPCCGECGRERSPATVVYLHTDLCTG